MIRVFWLAMLKHPEVQQKMQEEIDKVVGPKRLLSLSDRVNLPYCEAVLLECLRWHPISPLGIVHDLLHQANNKVVL
jgi:cytochrome P450